MERDKEKREGYDLTLADVAEYAGVSVSTLRYWIKNRYVPTPYLFAHRLWFTTRQAQVLHKFATEVPHQREVASTLVFLNWES
jgi:predicted site-specific integrase-resolvase